MSRTSKLVSLDQAVADIADGASVGLGGWIFNSQPMALVRALIRQGARNLDLVPSPGSIAPDLLIGAGRARSTVCVFISFEHHGLAPQFRRAAESGTLKVYEMDGPGIAGGLRASICDLPFRSGAFDLVVACEVLEHVDDPRRALEELLRVTSRFALLSVPHEPWWRVLNVLRGKYLRDRGNTPGHVQHFTAAAFRGFLGAQCRVSRFARPTPWLMALCERRAAPGAAGGESAEIGER